MRFGSKKRKSLLRALISVIFLAIFLFFPKSALLAKELAPHKIYGHLKLAQEIISNLDNYHIQVLFNRNGNDYLTASYQADTDPSYDNYYVVDIPIDDALKEGVPAPADKINLIINSFIMERDIELSSGQISQIDIDLCPNTELELGIEGVEDGENYLEDIIPIIRTKGCGVNVSATLNGEEYIPGEVIHECNHYTLFVAAEDASGESKQTQLSFTRATAQADGLNGEFSEGFAGWTIEGNPDLVSLTDETVMGPGGHAALIDVPGPSEFAQIRSDLIYALACSIVDLSFFLYGPAQDEIFLQVTSYSDQMKQNPVPIIDDERIFLTVNDRWQKISMQLIIPEDQYFIEISLGRSEQTVCTEAMVVDNVSLNPLSSIASTFSDGQGDLWIMVEDGTRNLVSGADDDLGIFDDEELSTISNIPDSSYGVKTLRLNQTQITRDVYLPAGTYTLSFNVWSDQSQEFAVDIGADAHILSAQSQLSRHVVEYALINEGWCSLSFNNQSNADIYVTRIQLEQGDCVTSYTPAGRSNGYLSFSFDAEQKMDFAKEGSFTFVFSPKRQGENLFLAGGSKWSIAYRTADTSLVFSMENMPDLCLINLGPDGLQAYEIYEVILAWDADGILLDLYNQPSFNHLGSAESSVYNKEIHCEEIFIGSRLTGINQSQASNCMFGTIYFETTCTEGLPCNYSLNHALSIPSLNSLAHMNEAATTTLSLNHAPFTPTVNSPAHLSEVPKQPPP